MEAYLGFTALNLTAAISRNDENSSCLAVPVTSQVDCASGNQRSTSPVANLESPRHWVNLAVTTANLFQLVPT
jgi:hypothetical protein